MGLVLVTPPAVDPVSLDDVKDHLRIFDTSEDGSVELYAAAARETMEAARYPGLDICLITQTWDLFLDAFPRGINVIEIPKPPLQTIVSISYTNPQNVTTTLDPATYSVDNAPELGPGTGPARVAPVSGWPGVSLRALNGVKVRFTAGFGDDRSAVPANLQVALMMLAGTAFENREATGDASAAKSIKMVPFGYEAYVGLYRRAGPA